MREIVVGYDSSVFIDRSIASVFETIGEAILLVVLVIYFFLRSLRATLIPMVTIPVSLQIVPRAKLEPSIRGAAPFTHYQFERLGYFCVDPDSSEDTVVFNRTVTLKDAWAKVK